MRGRVFNFSASCPIGSSQPAGIERGFTYSDRSGPTCELTQFGDNGGSASRPFTTPMFVGFLEKKKETEAAIFSFSESEDCGYQPPVSEHVDANDKNIDNVEKKDSN